MIKDNSRKMYILLQRRRKELMIFGYICVIGGCLFLLFDPGYLTDNQNETIHETVESFSQFSYFKPRPTGATLNKLLNLPMVPRDHLCGEMFHDSKFEFKYPETYEDHVDAFKATLMLNGILTEGVATEFSWIILSLGALPFVRTVCETHFTSGHNAFHWLASQDDLIVHSFAPEQRNYTADIADFLAIEFPDRFFMHEGDIANSVKGFRQIYGNDTKCDIVYIDTTQHELVIEKELEIFRGLAHPIENLVLLNTHPEQKHEKPVKLWMNEVAAKHITEIFRCSLTETDDPAFPKDQYGFMVGSYVGL